jgi:hypothetical protein
VRDLWPKKAPPSVKTGSHVSGMDLAASHGVFGGTMQNDLHDKLGLVKKSAKWVSKLMG